MLKKIWQSFMRWFNKLVGRKQVRSIDRVSMASLPPLDDTDREYLFMQLLEGVAHGWQQPRAISFFNKIRHRVRKSDWLEWLHKFGKKLLETPIPNYELAGRMVQLSQLDCGEVGDLAGEYANQLLNRESEASMMNDFLPIMEFSSLEPELLEIDDLSVENKQFMQFGEVPPELLLDHNSSLPEPQETISDRAESETLEPREITLEEFEMMLNEDPNLVKELAGQFGIETTDPQVVLNAVIAQMQQQVQPITGDLSSVETIDSKHPSAQTDRPIPPPPPPRQAGYKPQEPVNSIDSEL